MDQNTVVTIGSTLLLLQIASLAVNIWHRVRRSPPIDQTLREYVRRDEFDKERDERLRNEARLFDLVREITDRNASWQSAMSAQMGRIEASVESLKRSTQK